MTDEADDLFAASDPAVRAIAQRARALIRELLPDAVEQVDMADRLIAYGRDRTTRGLVCAVALQRSYANLMFARGTELPDPDGLLEGTGKHARHVKLRSVADVERPSVRALTETAWRLGAGG